MKKLLLTFITIITAMLPMVAMDNDQQEELNAKLFSALKEGTNKKVMRCLEKGANPNACDANGESALIRAIRFLPQVDFWVQMNSFNRKHERYPSQRIKLLLEAGADVNARTADEGTTALILAASLTSPIASSTDMYDYQPAIALLLEERADINAQDNEGYTALMLAVTQGRIEICRQLIGAGADIHTLDHQGATIFMHAACNNDEGNKQPICELLIERQQEIDARVMTALMCFHRLKKEGNAAGQLLYAQHKTLLLPYLGLRKYASLKKLLSLKPKETGGETAYEMSGIECLNPEKYI